LGIKFFSSISNNMYSPQNIVWLAKLINSHEIVHVHLFPAQLWVAVAYELTNKTVKLVTTEHSTYNRRRKVFFRLVDKWMYSKYRKVVCISDATALALVEWIPSIANKVQVIPNGINLDKFRFSGTVKKREIIFDESKPVILCVGRLKPEKDHATLLRAMVKVSDAHVVLVGDGDIRLQLKQLADNLGISERVHFLGQRQDIPELIKMADIYVQPSRWEGFGIATLEAMAGGLPIVASNIPGLNQVIGDAGILFPPGDSDALASAINFLLSSKNMRENFSKASIERSKKYSLDKTVDSYLDLYYKCLKHN
jgi:glycosyltransferase involved in cell wall biosynthesis